MAIVAASAPPFGAGGISSAHFNLYLTLRRLALDTRLFTFEDWHRPDTEGIIRRGFPSPLRDALAIGCALYFRLTCGCRNAYHLADILRTAPGALAMGKALRAFSPDVIVVPDHGAPALFLRRPPGVRVVLVAHHCPARFRSIPMLEPACEQDVRRALAIEQRALETVDAVVCPSAYMESVFQDTYSFDGPTIVIPNLVDRELLDGSAVNDVRQSMGLSQDAPLIYVPSAGSRFKGRDVLHQVVRGIGRSTPAGVGFYLSGAIDAELALALRALPRHVKVYAPGHLPYADNIAIVKACSYAVSPTLIESFGMALLEALHLGLPVVTFDVGATSELVRHDENGLLVRCPDVAGMVAAAATLLDPAPRARLRARMRDLPMGRFYAEHVTAQWHEVLFPPVAAR